MIYELKICININNLISFNFYLIKLLLQNIKSSQLYIFKNYFEIINFDKKDMTFCKKIFLRYKFMQEYVTVKEFEIYE